MNKTKHNCLLCILSLQSISYSSVLKTQLEMFSKCAQYKNRSRPERRRNRSTGWKGFYPQGILWGSCIFPLTTDQCNASFLFAIWRFPSQLVRWLYKLTSQVACKGLLTESLRSTSISSLVHLSLNFDGIPAGKLTELQAEESGESEEEC